MRLPRLLSALPAAVLLALSLSGCVPEPYVGSPGTMDDPRYAQLLDEIDAALKANKAVVLVADVNPHKTLNDGLDMTQWTPTVIWQNEQDPTITFGRRFQTNELQRDRNATYLFKAFEVHILPPGKYLLTGGDDYQIRGVLDEIGARSGPPGSGSGPNGTAYLSTELYREYYREDVWKDATYGTETRSQAVCTAVHMASGACVAWGEQQYSETTQRSGAGYYQQTDSRDVPSIKVQSRLPADKALASFTVQGGQLLLAPACTCAPRATDTRRPNAGPPPRKRSNARWRTSPSTPGPRPWTSPPRSSPSASSVTGTRHCCRGSSPCRSPRCASRASRTPSGAYRCR